MQLLKKLLGRHKERTPLKNPADDDHGMGPHDIDDGVAAELGKIVDANDGGVVTAPDVIYSCLEFYQVVNVGRIPAGPFRLANDPAERVWGADRPAGDTPKCLKHTLRIEPAIAEVGFCVGAKFELATKLCSRGVNSGGRQVPDMATVTIGTDDMDRFVARVEAILNEWEEDTIFFVFAVEKCTDVARLP
jgi:hypothetical protein